MGLGVRYAIQVDQQIPSFFGGTRQGMAIAWPARIKDNGGIRNQFHHVIDIVPTILEVTGIPAPVMVDGIAQKLIEGVSMAYSFDKANADAPSPHHTQYFEMLGVQGLYSNGWMLSAVPVRPPWDLLGKTIMDSASAYKFELYDVRHDWTQYTDVAAANPDKVREMTDLMFGEFAKYQVLPLDASAATRLVVPRPSLIAGERCSPTPGSRHRHTGRHRAQCPQHVLYHRGGYRCAAGRRRGRDRHRRRPLWRIRHVSAERQAGVPLEPVGPQRVRWEGTETLAAGKHTIEYDFKYDDRLRDACVQQPQRHRPSGAGTLKVDGKVVSTQTMQRTVPLVLPWDETFDIGSDTGTPVDDQDYQVPFKFTGRIDKLTISVEPPVLTPADVKKLQEAAAGAADAK